MDSTLRVDGIPKPKTDHRHYRWARLGNGLRLVLVQDEEAVFAAACVEVGVGYFDDPEGLPGLAHFVEHAVHLGTGKYPDERGYKEFLAAHGGKSNAQTGKTGTRFHFEVHNGHLKEALDRLSRFFIDPLLLPEALDREVLNVDSEYSKGCNSDARKLLDLQRSVGPSPLCKFSTGNITTLRDRPKELGINVPEVLKQWHKEACVGDNLTLAVISPHRLDDVEQWVLESFSLIPSRTGEQTPIPPDISVADAEAWGLRYYEVAPLRELRTLDLVWFIPYGLHTETRCKPWSWVGHHVGHEGHGSVAHHLKRKGLIQSLDTSVGEEVRRGAGFMLWHCRMQLTEKGLDHIPEIVAAVYEGIEILRQLPSSGCQTTYSELQELRQIQFDYKSCEQPANYASALAFNLRHYEASDLLTGPALLQEYSEPSIGTFLSFLVPENMSVFVASQRYKGTTTSVESNYKAKYTQMALPPELHALINNIQSGCHCKSGLRMVDACWAIPRDLSLREVVSSEPVWSDPPQVVRDSSATRLWYRHDVTFGIPKASLYIHLVSPFPASSARNMVAARLFARVVTDVLLPTTYSAERVSTSWSLAAMATGIRISFSGFNETLMRLVPIVIAKLTDLSHSEIEDRFTVMHGRLVQELRNVQYMDPHLQAYLSSVYLLTEPSRHRNELLQACDDVTLKDVVEFWETFSRDMYAEGLLHGNLAMEESLELWTDVERMLGATGLDEDGKWPVQRIKALPCADGDNSLPSPATVTVEDATESFPDVRAKHRPHCVKYVPDNANLENTNSAIHVVMQVGTDEPHFLVLADLFRAIAHKSCFHQLRTVECLGYIVTLEGCHMANVIAIGVRIQSQKATPRRLHERFDAWLMSFRQQLEDMPEGVLANWKASLKDKYLDPPKTPNQAAANFWRHIITRRYTFDLRFRAVAALEAASKRDLLRMYDTFIAPNSPSGRRLCTQVWSREAGSQDTTEAASDAAAQAAAHETPTAVVIGTGDEHVHKKLWEYFPGGSIVPHPEVAPSLSSAAPVAE